MPKFRVTLSDGRVVTLESDQQPNEADVLMAIGQQSAPKPGPTIGANRHQEARIGAAFPTTALPADTSIGESTQTRAMMNEPLARPTGIDAIDSLTSPTSLLSSAASFGGPVLRTAGRLASRVPVPTGAQILQGVKIARHPMREGLKMAADAVIDRMERPAAAAPVAEQAAAQAVFNPTTAMRTAREAFTAIGEKPLPAEASNAMELIRRGKAPEEAVAIVLKNRPKTVDPAAAFNARFGTLTDDEVRAALDLRNAQGKIKTPSAETARSRR